MPIRPRDPLLISARLLLTLIMGLVVLLGAAVLAAVPLALIFKDRVMVSIAEHTTRVIGDDMIIAIMSILGLIVVMAALAFMFLREMRRIVDSVGEGNAFIPINSVRLARMGWITVGIEVISIPAGAIGHWMAGMFRLATADFGFSLGGILLAVILFLLSRVFREGAAMREELEGTV